MYKTILVPTDGSALSNKAIKEAAKLAKLIQAELLLLHVREPHRPPAQAGGRSGKSAPRPGEKELEAREEQDLLKAGEKIADAMGVTTVATYVTGTSPYESIIATARKSKCGLIVMASHGRRGLVGLLLGSETQKVLTHATIPVLVVR